MRSPRRTRLSRGDAFRLLVLLAVFVAVLVVGLATDFFDRVTPRGVHELVRRAGVWAPALYLAGFVARPLTLAPLTLWLLVGGIAFGWIEGALLALVGVNLGAAGVFLGVRKLGRGVVDRFLRRPPASERPPKSWSARLVLSLQLFPFMPHDLLNAAAGCSTISYWRFLLGSAIGTLPFVILYTYAGSVLLAPGSSQFFLAFAALGALSLAGLAAARRLRGQEDGHDGEDADTGGDAGRDASGSPSNRALVADVPDAADVADGGRERMP